MKEKKQPNILKKTLRISLWVVGSIVALVVILFAVAMFMLTPARLTPLVNKYASQYLNAAVHFDEVDVSLFRDFPRVSLGLDKARIISYALDSTGRDTLARFERLYVSLDAMKLIDGDFDIRAVRLVGADLEARIDSTGRASWEIYTVSADTTTTSSAPISINVEKLLVEGKGRTHFIDERNQTDIEARFDKISALRLEGTKYAIELDLGLNQAVFDTVQYGRYMPLTLLGAATVDYKAMSVDSLKLAIGVNDVTVDIAGNVRLADTLIYSDLTVESSGVGLEKIVSFIPLKTKAQAELEKLRSDLIFGVALKVAGSYNLNNHNLPRITLDLKSNDGGVRIEGRYLKIDRFLIDASVGFEPSVPANNYVDLRNLEVQGTVGNFKARAKVTNALADYHVDGAFDGHIALSALNYWMPPHIRFSGAIDCNVNAKFARHQLKISKIGKSTFGATIRFDSVRASDDSTRVMLNGEITAKAAKDVFILKTNIDTINFDDRRLQLSGAGRDLRFATGIKAEEKTIKDTAAVYPFGGSIMAKRFNMVGADSMRIRMRDAVVRFSVIPDKRDHTVPKMQTSIEATSFSISQGTSRFAMGKTLIKASAEIIRSDKEIALARERRLDSLQEVYPEVPRGGLIAHNRKANPRAARRATEENDLDLNPGNTVRDLLRRWNARGELSTKSVRVSTPYLPLRTRLTDFDIKFSTDSIILRSLKGKVGSSDIAISGQVNNLRRALSSRGVLAIDIDMASDTLDVNQLIKAINAGSAAADSFQSADMDTRTDDQLEAMIAQKVDTTDASMLVLIPKNVSLDVRLKVNHAIYGTIVMDSLTTELISRNKVLQIRELAAGSDIGRISLHALYATPRRDSITTSADIELLGVDVKKLIAQMPEVDTMLPMLASFEGMVDVRAAAKARIDTAMNVIIPSLDAVASLSGRNLVLLDGQTFTEISKMLGFKNRKRNIVDKISVEMKIADERVEFFPFIFEIDRYKAAVSGRHGLDMEFDYHISVLKSILPFRVGVDIKGNLDDWDFKITQAKYKNENLPSYTYQIDSTRINLRNEIMGVFDKLNKEAANVQNR